MNEIIESCVCVCLLSVYVSVCICYCSNRWIFGIMFVIFYIWIKIVYVEKFGYLNVFCIFEY